MCTLFLIRREIIALLLHSKLHVIMKSKIALSSLAISLDHAYFFLSYNRLSCNILCELSMRTSLRTFSFTWDR